MRRFLFVAALATALSLCAIASASAVADTLPPTPTSPVVGQTTTQLLRTAGQLQQSPATAATATAATATAATTDLYARYLAPRSLCKGQDSTTASLPAELKTMRCLLNYVRVRRGLHRLADSRLLDRSSTLKTQAIVHCNQFSHTPCGQPFTTVFNKVGYTRGGVSWSVGENIAWGTGSLASPRATMDAWLNSPHHRANLFSASWRQAGISLVRRPSLFGYQSVSLWANQFGVRHR